MRRRAGLLVLAACGSSSPGPVEVTRRAIVVAYAGSEPEAEVVVLGHTRDGRVVEQVIADETGRADVGLDDDGYVSVVFPGKLAATAPQVTVVTVPAPLEGELAVHGPPHSPVPSIVGALRLSGSNLNVADYFEVTLGCATTRVTDLPATIDVGSCNLGSDSRIDVLARGYHDLGGDPPAPMLDGYAAGRATLTNGAATLNLPSWRTTGTMVPITLDGVDPDLEWTFRVDGIEFLTEPLIAPAGRLYTNLDVDTTTVQGSLPIAGGAVLTTREVMGTPTAIAFGAGDFLPPLDTNIAQKKLSPFTVEWAAAAETGADAANVHASWELDTAARPRRVIWEAVLPTDATSATFPAFEGELADLLSPIAVVPLDLVLRHVDSSELDGFDALVAAGLHAEDKQTLNRIVPRATEGQIRTSYVFGRE
ncbi:MAG: hypothetical protein HOV81_30925 [Kofleriaceae bacterium]|nr:hypothetical protein [Kofleriaceae bacterium]